mmetsp:Transcript_10656/g.32956  ORF Transcript_10656/g.32956 Transcript_10656/m.32956 type:complete len:376 (+) Transcript_10656:3-1130(+)
MCSKCPSPSRSPNPAAMRAATVALLGLALAVRADPPPRGATTRSPESYSPIGPLAPRNKPLPWGPAECFVKPTWGPQEVIKVPNIQYGSAYHPYKKRNITLLMDAFFPPASDKRRARPVVVLIHGGSFLSGEKEDEENWSRLLAARGYVVVSINYRIVPIPEVFVLLSAEPAVLAVEDARAAVRYLRKEARSWRIDTKRIAVGGESAGALATLYYAYVRKNKDGSPATEGTSGNPGYSSVINAGLSMSGAMVDRAYCAGVGPAPAYTPLLCTVPGPPLTPDLTENLAAGDIPGLDMHGTADTVIPYAGGLEWNGTAASKGVPHGFLSVPGAGHVPKGLLFDPNGPYLVPWLTFLAGSLNLRRAACPRHAEEPLAV